MRNSSNTAKFFIVCAVVFGIGLLATVLGAAFGGIEGFQKVAEKRNWISAGPGELTSDYINVGDFDKVKIDGDIDVFLITEEYYTNSEWLEDHDLKNLVGGTVAKAIVQSAELSEDETAAPEAGHVLIAHGDKAEAPKVSVEKGVLNITAPRSSMEGISIDFSSTPATPIVCVFCTEDMLASIRADAASGDIWCCGISFDKANIKSASGDVNMTKVNGNNTIIEVTSGDAALSGKFSKSTSIDSKSGDICLGGTILGETDLNSASGDVEIDTKLSAKKYEIKAEALSGDIVMSEGGTDVELDDEEENKLTLEGGPNKIAVRTLSGDIDLSFEAD